LIAFITMGLLPQWNGQNNTSNYAPMPGLFSSQEIGLRDRLWPVIDLGAWVFDSSMIFPYPRVICITWRTPKELARELLCLPHCPEVELLKLHPRRRLQPAPNFRRTPMCCVISLKLHPFQSLSGSDSLSGISATSVNFPAMARNVLSLHAGEGGKIWLQPSTP